jgi:hypothetical protein
VVAKPSPEYREQSERKMPLLGQASGGWTESSSALRILHVGVRNTVGVLTNDAFTQTNPPIVSTAGTVSTSPGAITEVLGVLSGSVSFARPDVGSNYIGGPKESGLVLPVDGTLVTPLGCFINSAAGNSYENLPASASGKGPYVSAQGCYGNRLYETNTLAASGGGGAIAAGTALTYTTGSKLIASRNGYLMPNRVYSGGAWASIDIAGISAEVAGGASASTTIGILKMPPDAVQTELVYDQRI